MRVDRQAIFDAVAEKSIFHKTAIGAILEAAGHFELVQKVQRLEKVVEAAREVVKPMTDFPKLLECRRKLKQALADLDALDGGGE